MMGALPSDGDAADREKPRHKVTLTKSLLVSKPMYTRSLYETVMGTNPSEFVGSKRPVEHVSWCDAVLFCNKLSEREGLEPCYVLPEPFSNDNDWSQVTWNKSANGYRLPQKQNGNIAGEVEKSTCILVATTLMMWLGMKKIVK